MSTTSARSWRVLWVATAALALAACTGPSADTGPEPGAKPAQGVDTSAPLDFAVITHGSEGDAFWSVVKNGAEDAGRDLGVKVTYNGDGEPAQQAKLIDNAVAQGKTGLVVSMANPDALKDSIQAAVRAGIPVITINSGADESKAFGAIAHVGQDETVAGKAAGEKLKDEGKKKVLCVIHEAANSGLNDRCQGAKDGFGGNVTNLQVDISNPTDTESRIRGALQTDPSIDGVLTLNSQVADLAVSAASAAGSKAVVATFDLNSDVVSSIKAGRIIFAVDQQQYEQGYLPIVMLKLYRDNGNTLGGGQPVFTGPGFVDKSNADQVGKYTERGTR
ncbi:sugar ABC transporter substrate-binding protein [Actinophytocola oryzae]|uniref:Monosaccharide ABC transporter substrate-binding protein (CUT2 family) n=1 Tax=Actinophytocola oryzae TaxID=502181 RepID=A0A4R7UVP7_9PSEU|nr:sugar ABC transporter substrate-binding protein [Actinophytocola oryzae]TDV40022.1 monosaccharide ABC transporter substrate-binding protein (CUT2 family) [Actinophytocola oryzae]